jgi:hypothetical protein
VRCLSINVYVQTQARYCRSADYFIEMLPAESNNIVSPSLAVAVAAMPWD